MDLQTITQKTSSLNLMFVEDDEILRSSTVDIFEDFFNEIFVCEDGNEGLETFLEKPIDIIITDISLPTMDGIEMIQYIRQKNQEVPILVMSAYNEDNIVNEAKKYGISGYIFKPLDFKQFLQTLEQIVS